MSKEDAVEMELLIEESNKISVQHLQVIYQVYINIYL